MANGTSPSEARAFIWRDANVSTLARMAGEGSSASQIAMAIGATRNAVIGKACRSGIQLNGKNSSEKINQSLTGANEAVAAAAPAVVTVTPPIRSGTQPKIVEALAEVANKATAVLSKTKVNPSNVAGKAAGRAYDPRFVEPPRRFACEPVPVVGTATIMDLTEHTCRWPFGNPGEEAFRYCGRPKPFGVPYCRAHAALAPAPAKSRHGTPAPYRQPARLSNQGA